MKTNHTVTLTQTTWARYLLLALIVEKIIQHIVVTLAFYFNWRAIVATVAVPPSLLMVLGGIVAILFLISLWGMLKQQPWAINLVMGLAVFDLVGEFAAQGRLDIKITVSFLVAALLLVVALGYQRRH
jgi:hypothetical protein